MAYDVKDLDMLMHRLGVERGKWAQPPAQAATYYYNLTREQLSVLIDNAMSAGAVHVMNRLELDMLNVGAAHAN